MSGRMKFLLCHLACVLLVHSVAGVAIPDAAAEAEAAPEADAQLYGGGGGAMGGGMPVGDQGPGCNLMDSCCGMSGEGCCMGGQQCYTYYENVCENVNEPQCNMKGREFCEPVILPDCRVVKDRGQLTVMEEVCGLVPKRECFKYTRTVCERKSQAVYEDVTWMNERLVKMENTNKTKCEMVTRCNYTSEVISEEKQIPKRVCEDEKETKEYCTNIPVTEYRTELRTDFKIEYMNECRMVSQPSCSTSPCSPSGCQNGGSVCSSVDYNTTTVCAQNQMAGDRSACQQVNLPVCYGEIGSCNYQNQQCCTEVPQQYCRQIPRRIPIQRNMSIPFVTMKRECRNVETSKPNCRTEYVSQQFNKTQRHCNEIQKEECFNYALPQYTVRSENKTEKVPFTVTKCERKPETAEYCHTFPNGDFSCKPRPSTRMYILNKVVCDRKRELSFCKIIPESECRNVQNQKCRAVPREVCQPKCSSSSLCNQCDNFRSEGGFSSCSSGTCPNFFPADSYVNITGGNSGQGFNPGYNGGGGGGQGFNPGYTDGGQEGFNPGYGTGDNYYNLLPTLNNNGGYNPGQMYYPLLPTTDDGGQGFNPGDGNGGLYYPLTPNGGQGFNPGDDGNNYYPPLDNNGGQQGFNPGNGGYYPLNPINGGGAGGGQGFNPGWGGNNFYPLTEFGGGQQGFNPGGGIRSAGLKEDSEETVEKTE